MSILIVAGLALLAYGLVSRVSDTAGGAGFGEVALDLPAGCVIAAARGEGERLILRATGPAERGCQLVVIFDAASGRELGRIRLAPKP